MATPRTGVALGSIGQVCMCAPHMLFPRPLPEAPRSEGGRQGQLATGQEETGKPDDPPEVTPGLGGKRPWKPSVTLGPQG